MTGKCTEDKTKLHGNARTKCDKCRGYEEYNYI